MTWRGPSRAARIGAITRHAHKLLYYLTRSKKWWEPGSDLDGLTLFVAELARLLSEYKASVGRCKHGHVIGPGAYSVGDGFVRCVACGAKDDA